MAVTRIKNNQITDATIVANSKVVDYSISSAKLANNLTYGSDLTITGNLTVNGNTTTIDTTITSIEDPVLLLASGQTSGTPTVDIGFIGSRGNVANIAFVWDESASEFITAFTSTGETNTTITVSSYANFHTNNANIGGNLVVGGNIDITGNVTSLTVTGNITGGNLLTPGLVSATSNITGGNLLTGGVVSATSNITGGNVLTGGLISATSTITSSANITGANLVTGGTVSATGNINTDANVNALSGNINSVGGLFTGNITVLGNINGAVTVVGNSATFYGDAVTGNGAIYAGIPAYTLLGSNVVVQFAGNANSYSQINFQNVSDGTQASTDYIATADNGDDSNYYVDLGINSSTFDDPTNYPGFFPNDSYVHNHGGNLLINPETAGKLIKFMVGGTDTTDIIATMSNTELAVTGIISATGNVTGANLLTGGLISATSTITSAANITGANLLTGGLISATSNITGGNVLTGGLISATSTITSSANITGGNILTAGQVSATGNVTGGNVNTDNIVGTGVTITSTGALNLAPTGNITANSKNINNLADPSQDQDAATKAYVDSVAQGLDIKASVVYATTTNLPAYTYNNGTSGVGATLTAQAVGNLTLDGTVVSSGQRVLIKNEVGAFVDNTTQSAAFNGIYTVTTAGSPSVAYVLTRTTDFDNGSPSGEIPGAFTFVEHGATEADTGWVCTTNAPVTVGTTQINWAQFSGAGSYTAGAGLSLTGTQFNVLTDGNANPTTAINGSNQVVVPANAEFITPNIGVATGTSLSATANITGGNVLTGGLISATSTITSSANITGGNVLTGGLISATSTITSSANIIGGNLTTAGQVSATANITGGNVLTGGLISATSTITSSANIIGGNLTTAGQVSATSDITGGNVLTGGLVSATGNITGGNILSGGSGSFTGNVTAANFFGNIAGNIDAAGSNTQVQFNDVGDILGASAAFTFDKAANLLTVTGNVQGGNLLTGGLISATSTITSPTTITGGNIATGGTASATGNVTGGNILTGGLVSATGTGTFGNVTVGLNGLTSANTRITINSDSSDVDLAVNGDTTANIFYIDAGTGTASFGTGSQTINALVAFNSPTSILMPVGNTGQRPGTGVTGMLRFNSTDNNLEIFDNSAWSAVGVPSFTVIADDQFSGDGSTVAFTLATAQTTNSCIVSINGVVQIPTSAYSVSGTTLTFTEAPLAGDFIDVREITTTTTVTSISNGSGNAVIEVSDTSATILTTGNIIPVANVAYSLGNSTNRFANLWLAGNTLTLGTIVMKDTGGQVGFFEADGTTPATIDAASVDTTTIANGTSNVKVVSSNGEVTTSVGGTSNVVVVGSTGVTITGNLTVTGNATLSGNILGDRIQNGTTSFDIQTQNGNANISVGGTSNVTIFSTAGVDVNGYVSVTGNLVGGNVLANGLISTTSNINGGNVSATGVISAASLTVSTGNVTLGNIVNAGANGVGNIGSSTTYFNTVFAKATSAQYADLAEKYVADAEYSPGTVVVFGGTHEVTVNAVDSDRKVAGVISTNPSYIMNGGLEAEHVATVALTGRVPCMVIGPVRKGDMMVAAGLGRARAEADPKVGTVIGKALEDFNGVEGTIEVVVGRF